MMKNWERRWFVLKNGELGNYKSQVSRGKRESGGSGWWVFGIRMVFCQAK